jgi:uracil-DNA glycosylase
MSTQQPTLNDCIESLRLHIRSRQRTGLRFDVGSKRPDPAKQMSRAQLLETLRNESADCQRCPLCNGRTHVVFGEGNDGARLMFVGDAPDSASDTQGRAFAGESGQLLTKIIEAIKLQRSQVYLTTAVKCIVPQGDPGDDALEACLPFLQRQIEIIQPDIICALGPVAARILQDPQAGSVPQRGTLHRMGSILVMPTHHPELLLIRPELKNETWKDVQIIQRELESGTTRKQ